MPTTHLQTREQADTQELPAEGGGNYPFLIFLLQDYLSRGVGRIGDSDCERGLLAFTCGTGADKGIGHKYLVLLREWLNLS